jgi:hypothetical protein
LNDNVLRVQAISLQEVGAFCTCGFGLPRVYHSLPIPDISSKLMVMPRTP